MTHNSFLILIVSKDTTTFYVSFKR